MRENERLGEPQCPERRFVTGFDGGQAPKPTPSRRSDRFMVPLRVQLLEVQALHKTSGSPQKRALLGQLPVLRPQRDPPSHHLAEPLQRLLLERY